MVKYTIDAFHFSEKSGEVSETKVTISDDDDNLDWYDEDKGEKEIASFDDDSHAISTTGVSKVTFQTDDGDEITEVMVVSELDDGTYILTPTSEDSQFGEGVKLTGLDWTEKGFEHEDLDHIANASEGKDEDEKDEKEDEKEDEKDGDDEDDDEPCEVKFTVEAFKYIGRGPYDEPEEMTITDDDDTADWFNQEQGEAEQVELGGETFTVSGTGVYRLSFTTENGDETTEDFVFSYVQNVGWMFTPAEEDSQFTSGSSITEFHGWQDTDGVEYETCVCFAAGSMIETPNGPRRVESLRVGQRVCTLDHGAQRILWTANSPVPLSRQILSPQTRAVHIPADALAPGCPDRPLRVSPNHRILLQGPDLALEFATCQALVPARALIGWNGIRIAPPHPDLQYHHILLENHEVLFSNGLASESLLPDTQALRAMNASARASLKHCLRTRRPDATYGPAARLCLTLQETRALLGLGSMPSLAYGATPETLPDLARTPHERIAGTGVLAGIPPDC